MSDEVQSHAVEGTETREEIKPLAEISASKSQASTSHNEVLLDIRDKALLLTKLGQLEEELHATMRQKYSPNEENRAKIERIPKIKRIPEIMKRNVNLEKYFTPKEWKFGPIHPDRFSYHDTKLKLAAYFISESGSTSEVILKDFESKIKDIRTCFDKDMTSIIGDEELMRLLFLDGCAILGFIHCSMSRELQVVGISDAQAADMEQDFLLLENQIPFRVLEVLIGPGKDEQKYYLRRSFRNFIIHVCCNTFPRQSPRDLYEFLDLYCFRSERSKNSKPVYLVYYLREAPVHLLDVFREAILFSPRSFDSFEYMLTLIRGTFWILCSCGGVAICYFLGSFKPEPYLHMYWIEGVKQFFQSVQELKAAGIKFKPSHSLRTISFRSRFYFRPQLMLPTLNVDDSTAYKLLNLVAYEMCLSESNRYETLWVTSYVNLLDSLVDNEQDIKDLRASDILLNTLSTDILAAELINNVGAGCVAPTGDAYEDVRLEIGKYYKTTCAVWMAQVCTTHFSSPWTILALLAATVVLILTAVQTWYAVNPKK